MCKVDKYIMSFLDNSEKLGVKRKSLGGMKLVRKPSEYFLQGGFADMSRNFKMSENHPKNHPKILHIFCFYVSLFTLQNELICPFKRPCCTEKSS